MLPDWTPLTPRLPRGRFDHGKPKRQWPVRMAAYAELPKTGLLITGHLVTPVIFGLDHEIHLDGMLGFAALTTHPVESLLDPRGANVVPIPVALAWISPDGLPLWASTPLRPVAPTIESREYWHKRHPADRADFAAKPNANTSAGRYKEYRTPVRAHAARTVTGACIGNRAEIERLLAVVTHIGKKGTMGYGRVARWDVVEIDTDPETLLRARPVPVGYYAGRQPIGILVPRRGWTSPYWFAPWWADCLVPEAG